MGERRAQGDSTVKLGERRAQPAPMVGASCIIQGKEAQGWDTSKPASNWTDVQAKMPPPKFSNISDTRTASRVGSRTRGYFFKGKPSKMQRAAENWLLRKKEMSSSLLGGPLRPKTQHSAWNFSYSLACDARYVSRASTRVYEGKTTSGKTCRFRTFQEYTKCRIKKGNAKLFGHFADRLWVNQWRRNECCGARVPKIIKFFAAAERERAERCLREFAGPEPGAVVKLNHMAGDVTGVCNTLIRTGATRLCWGLLDGTCLCRVSKCDKL